jgi:hypothetical protein
MRRRCWISWERFSFPAHDLFEVSGCVRRYGVAVGLAAGSGVADCSGLGLGLLTGDSFGVGDE